MSPDRPESSEGPLIACVLAGGSGTRLYPASRSHRPKQFLEVGGERSLLWRTLERVRSIADERYVLTSEGFEDGVRKRVPQAGVLVEPEARGTGPALVYAAWRLRQQVGDCVLVTLPSDHHVDDVGAFRRALERAAAIARETSGLVTLGVEPMRPATEFGYIVPETDDEESEIGTLTGGERAPVARFREKPDRESARSLLEAGAYWNAGIFAWTPEALLREARRSPLEPFVDALERGVDPARAFADVEAVSVDTAILERTEDAFVTPLPSAVGWDDLGTWDALGRVEAVGRTGDSDDPENGRETVVIGETDLLAVESTGNVVAAPDCHVSLLGVDELVVATIDDRVLVTTREDADRVRELADELRKSGLF